MSKRRMGVRSLLVSLSLILSIASSAWSASPAEAYYRHHHHYYWRFAFYPRHFRPTRAAAPSNFAAFVVDGNSGRILYTRDENELRHPASITKVMTLYLLFEQLEKGRLRLDSRLPISEHAAEQAPTKLGLRPGETIRVEDAIKAIVTLSANDMAVAVAEAIGGNEETFATMMTRKAHALGMSRTHYANASGLPNEEQITTAADLALLGRAIQERFPRYYRYFSTQAFVYDGRVNRNHNHLLGRIEGMDGIKTGYTRESGFNLLTSVKRDGHFIIAVVLGGPTAASRDRIMANLIETEIGKGSTRRTAPMIAEVAAEKGTLRGAEPTELAEPMTPDGRPIQLGPMAAADPLPVASITPMPVLRPRPAFVSASPVSLDTGETAARMAEMKRVALDGSTERPTTSTTTPSMLRLVVGPAASKGEDANAFVAKAEPQIAATENSDISAQESQNSKTVSPSEPSRPAIARSGWMIQIGATDDPAQASDLLARAKAHGSRALGDAQPFTEKVQKGEETLYRARFAGLDAGDAQAACKSLRRSGFACFATKN
jgi:D-alanyl-D-alanine carboxypeptidase